MSISGIIQEIGAAAVSNPVCCRLLEVSIEVAVLSLAVWGLIHLLRIRSARLCSLLWMLVLAKGLLGLTIGAPFDLAGLRVAAPSSGAGQTVATAGMTAEERAQQEMDIRRALSEVDSLSTSVSGISHTPADRRNSAPAAHAAGSQRDAGISASRWAAVFSVRNAVWILLGAWVAGVLWGLLRTTLDLRRIRRLCRASDKAPGELLAVFHAEMARLRIAPGPQLRACDQIESPALVGFWRPTVVVPSWLAEASDPMRVRWILAHELMHWKLKDTAGLFVRRMAQALLWFHPAVWWVGARWEEAMERACDRALIAGETDARDYAGQLYQVLEGLVERRSRVRVSAGLFATRTQIGRRIAALLTNPLSVPSRLSPSALTLLVLLALAALSFGVGINQAAPEQGKADASKEQTKSAKETAATEAPKPLLNNQERQSSPGTEPQKLAEIPEPLDRRLLEHIPKRYENTKPFVELLVGVQEKEKRPNALLYYTAAIFVSPDTPDDALDLMQETVRREGWSEKAEPLKPYLESCRPAFELIRKGAALDYAKGIGFHGPATPVPSFLKIQVLAKSLCVEALRLESLGKHREALENYLTALAMGRDLMSPDSFLISHLVGVAVTSIGTRQIRAEIISGKLSAADLERCRSRLGDMDKAYPALADAFRFESHFTDFVVARMRKDGNAEGVIKEWAPAQAADTYRQAAKDVDGFETGSKKTWDAIVRNAETPWWSREETKTELERVQAAYPLAAKALPDSQEAETRCCMARAGLRLARLAAGLETYKLENGRYPDSLDALTPSHVGNEPAVDPFSGKSLGYRLDGDRYVMWSIGPDSADNAGETIYDATNGTTSAGDIVVNFHPAQTAESKAPSLSSGDEPKRLSNEQEEIVRKKMLRAMTDLRSVGIAMEAYRVDFNTYTASLTALTTPIAYLSPVPSDPFSTRDPAEPYRLNVSAPDYHPILYSIGPDTGDQKGLVPYDASNGTISGGDIARQLESTYRVMEDKELQRKIEKQESEVANMEPLVFLWYIKTRQGLPENLEEVVKATGYLKEVPEDAFVPGRKLSYRLDAKKETAWIYSLGPDGADDGGNKKIGGVIKPGEIPKGDIFAEISLADLQDRYPEIPEPLDRRLLEHVPKRYVNWKSLAADLLDLQEKEKRPNALLYYVTASFLIPPLPNNTQKDLIQAVLRDGWSEKAESLKSYIETWQPAFGLIRKGAAFDYAKGIGYHGPTTNVPNFLAAQLAGKALCIEGRYFESVGKQREALEDYLTAIAMGRDYMSPGNQLISDLIGIAIIRIGANQIYAEVTGGKLSAADLERCRTRLEALDKTYPTLADCFRVEYLCHEWYLDRIRKGGNVEDLIKEWKSSPEDAAEIRGAAKDMDRIEADQKKVWDLILENAETPWWKRNQEEYRKEEERLLKNSHPMVGKIVPNFLEADTRRCSALAGLRLARVATGLETHKLEHKRYPDSLDALTPAQAGSEPAVDPFTGKPLCYRLDGDRYTLWSIGPDNADNAGETIYDATNGTTSAGDIVLRR